MRPSMLLTGLLLSLAGTATAGQTPPPTGWTIEGVEGMEGAAGLSYRAPAGGPTRLQFFCAADGLRLILFLPRAPRGLPQGTDRFETSMRLFLGRRIYGLASIGTPLPEDGARLEALVPVELAVFAAMARQGRLVVVHFAGRTTAPAPAPDLVSRFRAACPPPALSPAAP